MVLDNFLRSGDGLYLPQANHPEKGSTRPRLSSPGDGIPTTDAELTDAHRVNELFNAHRNDPEFGYRYLVEEARDAGVSMAERTA